MNKGKQRRSPRPEPEQTLRGLVVKNTGSWYVVRPEGGGALVECKIKGNFRLKGLRCTNPVAVGDVVAVDLKPDGTGMIARIEPRRNYIIRRASNLSKEFQIIASNIDQAVLVMSLLSPMTNTTFVDRFLATAEAYDVPAVLVINKVDLLTGPASRAVLDETTQLYRSIGYSVVHTSTVSGEGLDELREVVGHRVSLLSGNSGVGKSSLINQLVPGADLRVGEVSHVHHKGMHTTTFSEMLDLPGGGALVDTPGVKGFGTIDFERSQVAHYFREIFALGQGCRYGDCTHTHEPGCGVLQALESGEMALSRYQSYLSIIDEDPDNKYRKPQ